MFADLFVVATVLTTLAVATPTEMTRRTELASSCSTGTLNCCNSSGTAKDENIAKQLASLNIVVENVNTLIGVTCSPITGVGIGSDSCSSQALCCSNNNFNGVVALGCTPINLP